MRHLLHQENLERLPFVGNHLAGHLEARADEVAARAAGLVDPPISLVIRARNQVAQMEELFDDIKAQAYSGEAEVVVVDTESTDNTAKEAKRLGATVVSISQDEFSYPRSLNIGFRAASHDWIYTLVGHAHLSNNQTLRVVTGWQNRDQLGGVYGISLPDKNASLSEIGGALILRMGRFLKMPASPIEQPVMGVLAANCSVINRQAWEEVGEFDERYGAGGEDGALARSLVSSGFSIIRDPAMSVFHTHGLGPINSWHLLQHWRSLDKPQPFDQNFVAQHKPGAVGQEA